MFTASPVEASDDSSDDKPLIKKKIVSAAPAKKIEKKGNKSIRSNGTNDKAGGYINKTIFECFFKHCLERMALNL